MSIIARDNMSKFKTRVYCKGSPESILNVCKEESIPHNYTQVVESYAELGLRIIAFA